MLRQLTTIKSAPALVSSWWTGLPVRPLRVPFRNAPSRRSGALSRAQIMP